MIPSGKSGGVSGKQGASSTDSRHVCSAGEYLQYRTLGNGPRPVVLLHGFSASRRTWDDLIGLFPPGEYTLHLFDLKGHGDSSKQPAGDYSAINNARIITEYIRSRLLTDVILIGHSFGGTVALMTSLACPDVERLILIGAPAFPQKIPPFMRILALPFIGPLLMNAVPAETIARSALKRAFYRRELISDRLVERYASGYRCKGSSTALSHTVRQMLPANFSQITAGYASLSIPVLLVWGEQDQIVRLWQAERLQRELCDSRLVVIPDCGHNPHEERPHETFNVIREFISAKGTSKQTPMP